MLSWQNILNSRQIVANIERKKKLANQGEVLCTLGGISPIDLSLSSNGNHGHIISEQHWKSTFNFTEIVNKYGLKGGTVYQIVRFISQFYLKLYIQFWKYFNSMVLGGAGRGYCGKNGVLEFLGKSFG